jgi:hypothetical protein
MNFPPNIFTSGALAPRRSAHLHAAWRDAADDVHEAYRVWRDADRPDRTAAFLVYIAALDREDTVARNLELR